MPKRTKPVRRRLKKKDAGMPTGRRVNCITCGRSEQVSFGNRTQAAQAAKVRNLDPRNDLLYCTAQNGKVHLTA